MKYEVRATNKPIMRGYHKDGSYWQYKNMHSAGRVVFDNIEEATKQLQDYMNRGWDAQIQAVES